MLIGPLENPSKQTESKWTYPHWWYTIEENKDKFCNTNDNVLSVREPCWWSARETKLMWRSRVRIQAIELIKGTRFIDEAFYDRYNDNKESKRYKKTSRL